MEDQSDVKVPEWGMDLPSVEDLTPITQSLISPELALAFEIIPEPSRAMIDLNVASHANYSMNCPKDDNFEPLSLFPIRNQHSDSPKLKRVDSIGPDESNSGSKEDIVDDTGLSRAVKRPRLVWTPQLHKRFVDVIEHLGIDKAVPKTIMEMMNVEGLTRENVASHLQKYRLYLKRMEGLSSEAHSSPRRAPTLFECDRFSPIPIQSQPNLQQQPQQSLHCNAMSFMPMPMPMPMVGPSSGPYGFGPGPGPAHLGFPVGNSAPPGYCGLESGSYNFFWNRQRG